MPSRVRVSLQQLEGEYKAGNRKPLEKVITAFRYIQSLEPENPNSYFAIAGFHGEPFSGPGAKDGTWWGGFCNHSNVLFPTWHRAYLLRLEDALRTAPGCEDVTVPYLDELWTVKNPKDDPIPSVLTDKEFAIAGVEDKRNPLYSYRLQKALKEKVTTADNRYTKHKGYETVRYPLSGLVGTTQDRYYTDLQNAKYGPTATQELNANVRAWLHGTAEPVKDDDPNTGYADTYSLIERFRTCLRAPNYTIFSNTASHKQAIEDAGGDPNKDHFIQSLESPHNGIHLSLGGFYQKGAYDASPILGANGDMGDNETASFDPIFFIHHSFIDLIFWKWQTLNQKTAKGSLDVIEFYPGTVVVEGSTGYAPGTLLTMDSPLYPFKNPKGGYYTPNDMVDIENQLGYTYDERELGTLEATPEPKIVGLAKVSNINRASLTGSFVIRTFAQSQLQQTPLEIGREAVLSRNNISGCANCQNFLDIRSYTPIDEALLGKFNGGDPNVTVAFSVVVQDRAGNLLTPPGEEGDDIPTTPIITFKYWNTNKAELTHGWRSLR